MAEKVLFHKSAVLVPIRKGLYKDAMTDTVGFNLLVSLDAAEDSVDKARPVRRERKWGDDPEFDAVMCNFGLTPGKPGEEIQQQLVFGWANVAVQEDGSTPFDWEGDIVDTEILEAAAYNFVLSHGLANQSHEAGTECGWLIESMMFTKEKMAAIGIPEGMIPEGWFVGFYVPDPAVYKKVIDGTFNMFSIEGSATRVPVEGVLYEAEGNVYRV